MADETAITKQYKIHKDLLMPIAVIQNVCRAEGDDGEHLRANQAAIQRVERARAEADAREQAEAEQQGNHHVRYAHYEICGKLQATRYVTIEA